jgi:hypothetical protein
LNSDSYKNDWREYGVRGVGGSNPLAPTNKFGQVEKVSKLLVRFQTVSAYQLKSTPAASPEWGFRFAPTGWLRGMRSFLPVQTASNCSQKTIFYQFLPALKR